MRTIEKEVWLHKDNVKGSNLWDVKKQEDPDYIKVKMSFDIETYQIKLIEGLNGFHLVNDSSENRMPFSKFIFLIKQLKKSGRCAVIWDIYPGQPVQCHPLHAYK